MNDFRDRTHARFRAHTSGRTIAIRASERVGYDDANIDKWIVEHQASDGRPEPTVMAGYYIGRTARVWQLVDDALVCHHSLGMGVRYHNPKWRHLAWPMGLSEPVLHKREPHTVYDWWDARWGASASPADICDADINATSLSVDLVPMSDGTYSRAQTAALSKLLDSLCSEHGIPRDRRHVLGHADVDPQRRGTVVGRNNRIVGVDWDPGRLEWSELFL